MAGRRARSARAVKRAADVLRKEVGSFVAGQKRTADIFLERRAAALPRELVSAA
jgi:hypothetical protein